MAKPSEKKLNQGKKLFIICEKSDKKTGCGIQEHFIVCGKRSEKYKGGGHKSCV